MKIILIPTAFLLVVSSACAQRMKESDVPAVVKQAFTKQFASAKGVKWSKESETEFEAEFKTSQGEQSANFDTSGKWLITETEISEKSLPAVVMQTLEREFAGYKVEESERAETPDKGSFYEIKLEQGRKTIIAQISGDGKIVKVEEEKEESDKD
jgi:hypothetical protein